MRQARGETIDRLVIINAEGLFVLQMIGTTAEDCSRGRRVSRTETVAGDALMRRLAELVPGLCRHDDEIRAVTGVKPL